jgi:hypothetical protein
MESNGRKIVKGGTTLIVIGGQGQLNRISPVLNQVAVVQPHENVSAPPPKKSFSQRLEENNGVSSKTKNNNDKLENQDISDMKTHSVRNNNNCNNCQVSSTMNSDVDEEIVNSLFMHFIQTCSTNESYRQPKKLSEAVVNIRSEPSNNQQLHGGSIIPLQPHNCDHKSDEFKRQLSGMIFSLLGRNFSISRNQLKKTIVDHGGEVSEKITHRV